MAVQERSLEDLPHCLLRMKRCSMKEPTRAKKRHLLQRARPRFHISEKADASKYGTGFDPAIGSPALGCIPVPDSLLKCSACRYNYFSTLNPAYLCASGEADSRRCPSRLINLLS